MEPNDNIILDFDVSMALGTYIDIDLIVVSGPGIDITLASGNISFSGNQVTINPPADLVSGTTYEVVIAPGALKATGGLDFPGASNGLLQFTVN